MSYWTFLLVAAGSSVGLGNIWKFPYEAGTHDGGTFLLIYIPCVLLIAFPLMIAEIMIGRRGRANPIHAVRKIARDERVSSLWQSIGWLGVLTGLAVFSFYSVVASWILFYIMKSVTGSFVGVPAEIVQHSYGALLRNSDQMLMWQTVFVLMVVQVLTRGVRQGLERAYRILMPCFIALLIWLCVYASQVGNFEQAIQFLTTYDLAKINAELIVSALGQAFFSLSIGMGVLVMFGAYFREDRPIATAATVVMVFDTFVAITMALMIFSIVFAFGMRPDSGPGLIFETLPVAFSQMAHNSLAWSALFFFLLLVASLTSAIALLDPLVQWLTESWNLSRRLAAWMIGAIAWLGGLLSVYSYSDLQFSFYYFGIERFNGGFDFLNILTTHILMPLTALLVALFAGWGITREHAREQLAMRFGFTFRFWHFCTRLLAPFIICLVLIIVLFYPA